MNTPTTYFKTRNDNTCYVKIVKKGVPAIMTNRAKLGMPAISLETEADTGVDTAVLQTTGKMSLIMSDDLSPDTIMPDELLDTTVEVSVEKDGSEKTVFFGYVIPQKYSQPYDSYPYQMDINIKGALSILEDVTVEARDDVDYARVHPFAYYLMEAMEAVGFTPSKVVINAPYNTSFLSDCIQREWFLKENAEYTVSGSVDTPSLSADGISWLEAFEKIMLANAMVMWQDGDCLYFQSKHYERFYFEYSWSDIEKIANGETAEVNLLSVPQASSFSDVIFNMSSDNKQEFIQPSRSLSVNQELDDRALFSVNEEWFDKWYIEALTDADWIAYLFRSACLQRGVTLTRRLYSNDGSTTALADDPQPQYTDLDSSVHIGYYGEDGEGYQVGAAVGFVQCVHKNHEEDEDDPISLEDVSPKFYLMGSGTNWTNVPAIEIVCPVCVGDGGGAICLDMSLKSGTTDTKDRLNDIDDNLIGAPQLRVSINILNAQKNASFQSTTATLLFDGSGNVLTNCKNNAERYEEVGETVLENSRCMQYDDVRGYVFPLSGVATYDKNDNYYVRVTIYALTVNDISTSYPHIYEISDLEVSYHREVIVDNNYYPERTEKKRLCSIANASAVGEDLSVDLDTWVEDVALPLKDGRTLQPPILDMSAWGDYFSEMNSGYRRLLTFEDARMDGDPLTLVTGDDGNTYRQVGCGSWDSDSEGGRKTYVQVIQNGVVNQS